MTVHLSDITGDLLADLINEAAGDGYSSITDELDALVEQKRITQHDSIRLFSALGANNPAYTAGSKAIAKVCFAAGRRAVLGSTTSNIGTRPNAFTGVRVDSDGIREYLPGRDGEGNPSGTVVRPL